MDYLDLNKFFIIYDFGALQVELDISGPVQLIC